MRSSKLLIAGALLATVSAASIGSAQETCTIDAEHETGCTPNPAGDDAVVGTDRGDDAPLAPLQPNIDFSDSTDTTPSADTGTLGGATDEDIAQSSDIRLKQDIVELSRLKNGLGLYRFRYLNDDQVYVGVMAQEVEQIAPDAVVRGDDGYLRVKYGRLGLRMMTWEGWSAEKAETLH